ncbi:MAG TPA: T9SS type A sorting domain-containing protein [Edaphocola sp.]|nr:T9SS type A sorting domain-containing protein [Edaphocola sp.]
MKKIILLIITLLGITSLFAQTEFAPLGAKWTYRGYYENYASGGESLTKHECIDTIIRNGITIKAVSKEYTSQLWDFVNDGSGNRLYHHRTTTTHSVDSFYQQNDTVFVYNKIFLRYTPLYILNAQAGDTITLPILDTSTLQYVTQYDSTMTYIIDSVKMVNYNGSIQKTFFTSIDSTKIIFPYPVSSPNYETQKPLLNWTIDYKKYYTIFPPNYILSYYSPLGVFTEKFGGLGGGLLPKAEHIQSANIGDLPFVFNLLECYEDSSISYQQVAFSRLVGLNCDSLIINNPLSIKNHNLEIGLSVYPNPSTNIIHIVWKKEITQKMSLSVFDIMGRKVIDQTEVKVLGGTSLNTSSLPSGIYWLKLSFGNSNFASTKFIKQ